jgi:tetratricopeptide (TPR) repeat protein
MHFTSKSLLVIAALCVVAAGGAVAQQAPATPASPAPTPQPEVPVTQLPPAVAQSIAQQSKSPVGIESSSQLFATMCALDAAGFDPEGGGTPARMRLRAQMESLHGPAVDALRKFYQDHVLGDPGATLSRYVVYALVMGPPPDFEIQVHREDVSPDALALEGFGEVLANFYAEAHIDSIWQQVQPQYEAAATNIAGPISDIVLVTGGYLREVVNPHSPQTFTVYVEPLVGVRSNFLNLGDQYAFIVDPGRDLPLVEIRHAFLHFFLDPLAYRFHNTIVADQRLLDFAVRAPRLPPEYRDDFTSYFTECLVRAVELRLDHPTDLEARLVSEDEDGYVLVRPLVTQLMKFEKEAPPMSLYYPDLVHGINVGAEAQRLDTVKFAPRTEDVEQPHVAIGYADNADLIEGEQDIALNHADGAAAAFERVLARHPNEARAVYGLAVASLMQNQAGRAEELFEKIIAAGTEPASTSAAPAGDASGTPTAPVDDLDRPDARMLSWSHVYLGRLYDVQGDRDHAVIEYRAALSVEGAPDSAKAAAQKGVDQSFATPNHAGGPGNSQP